jgi:hypothetical protein
MGGRLEVVGALLAKGADVQAKDNVSIARAFAVLLSISLTYTYAECGWLPLGMYLYASIGRLLLSLKIGRRLGFKA